jgi:hypothetical protein
MSDLRLRLRRLCAGETRTDDLDRLYLGLRERAKDCEIVREIGDFIAHRDTREKGLLTSVFRDVLTSLDIWSRPMRGVLVGREDVIAAAHANLRLASDEQLLAGCGGTRAQVTTRLTKAIAKMGQRPLKDGEIKALSYLGTAFIWKPAFTAEQLIEQFGQALSLVGLIDEEEGAHLSDAHTFITLHALAVMHGSILKLPNGLSGRLWAGYANKDRFLEVKVEISFDDAGKPLMTPICLFLSKLLPEAHCAKALVHATEPTFPWHWTRPVEVDGYGRLNFLDAEIA